MKASFVSGGYSLATGLNKRRTCVGVKESATKADEQNEVLKTLQLEKQQFMQ